MKVPFNWLKEFVAFQANADEVAGKLTMRGLEVEGIERTVLDFAGVCVGEIVAVEKPSGLDKLSLCRVRTRPGQDPLPVLCGAPNAAMGQKVALALPGARFGSGLVIEKKVIKGIESYGMLCSERELALSDDHSGIMVLPDTAKVGDALVDALHLNDAVLDVNVPPNRGDCQSILGIAREVASIFGIAVTLPPVVYDEGEDIDGLIDLEILDFGACPRYVLRMIRNISIVASPFFMKDRIAKCGMRPINSIVDVTNYVMLELGQPLHAFDYARIAAKKIVVKAAEGKSVFRTLDGIDRKLEEGDVLICDGSGPVALAGVMGGENSEISPSTTDVALESAFFNPLLIRRTARRLDLRSEASARFEKGIDIENVDYAARRAIALMQETSGGGVLRNSKELYNRKEPRYISLSAKRTEQVIGVPVEQETIVKALESIDIRPTEKKGDVVTYSIPSFRYHDINEYVDLIEEVARIVGYSNIPPTVPVTPLVPVRREKQDIAIDSTREYLTSCGFFEVINFGFFNVQDIVNFRIALQDARAAFVPLLNPISKELGVMRTFLTPGVLENIAYNLNRGTRNLRLFEIGKVFHSSENNLPRELLHLCMAITGKEREYFWRDSFKEFDFFDLKGVIEGLSERFNLSLAVTPATEPFLEPTRSADLWLDDARIGWAGEIQANVTNAYDIKDKVFCAELDVGIITVNGNDEKTYRPISRSPAVTRDFSFYVDDTIPVSSLIAEIRAVSPLIVSVGIFDIFKKEVRSISFRAVFQSFEDTLTDERVNDLQRIIIEKLMAREGVKLRT
jgi:phenylalanyl-tRNA synthetase beta chain